jgi:hypothetical protein
LRRSRRNRRSRKDSPPLSRRISLRSLIPDRPAASSDMRFVNLGMLINRRRTAESMALSMDSVLWCEVDRSMTVRVAEVVRTSRWDRRSPGCHCLVVCSRTVGSSDRRTRGTTISTWSSSKPSSPHHRAAVVPYSAASRPSDIAAARTRNSQVRGVARCRKTRSDSASQTPSFSRSHHCCEVKPQDATSSRLMRSCCLRAMSISAKSFFTQTRRHSEMSKAESKPALDAGGHAPTVFWTVAV